MISDIPSTYIDALGIKQENRRGDLRINIERKSGPLLQRYMVVLERYRPYPAIQQYAWLLDLRNKNPSSNVSVCMTRRGALRCAKKINKRNGGNLPLNIN